MLPDIQYLIHLSNHIVTRKMIEIIPMLSVLPTLQRSKDLKLINKIFSNVLKYPNKAKYKRLDKTKLGMKLMNSTLWFELLSLAGFDERCDKSKLIFDITKLDRLKYINNLLLTYDQIVNSLSKTQSSDRKQALNVIDKIINNILSNQNEDRYLRLNITIISKKLNNWSIWHQLLLTTGFYESNNGKYLLYDKENIPKLEIIGHILSNHKCNDHIYQNYTLSNLANNIITSMVENFDDIRHKTYEMQEEKQSLHDCQLCLLSLLKQGFPLEDALNAIVISTNNDDCINYHLHNLRRIDNLLRLYYKQFNVSDYFNNETQTGRFLQYIQDMKLDNDTSPIEDQLGDNANPSHCQYVNFDIKNFPFDNRIDYIDHKRKLIFFILQYCYRFNSLPEISYILNAQWKDVHDHQQRNTDIADLSIAIDDNVYEDCGDAIENCIPFNRFLLVMYKYNHSHNNDSMKEMDNMSMIKITNDYLHLIREHKKDRDFELIVNHLGDCGVMQCNIFKRHHCRDSNINEQKTNDERRSLYCSMMDKMHCYFMHSIDIGTRLSIEEKQLIGIPMDYNLDEELAENTLKQDMIINIHKVLSKKRQKHKNIVNSRRYNKYNQFCSMTQESKSDECIVNTSESDDKMYNFGYGFIYGYPQEDPEGEKDSIYVTAKYASFKHELICNDIYPINRFMFNNEYKKAQINHASYFAKRLHEYMPIQLECVLAITIYCNYDMLQYFFSKTYREHDGKKHSSFYFLGKYLKMCVHVYGTGITEDEKYYHGINKKLVFPTYFNNLHKFSKGIIIKCPLSTTMVYEVATRFAQDGLIIQFGCSNSDTQCQYYSTAWLSDYPDEKEYLFVQNKQPLRINDIIDSNIPCSYATILNTLEFIIYLINMNDISRDSSLYRKSHGVGGGFGHYVLTIPHESKYVNEYIYQSCDDITRALITVLIENQILGVKFKFKSLQEYGQKICKVFLENQRRVIIDYSLWKKKYSFVYDKVCYSKCEWIDICMMNKLFPNLQHLTVRNVNLCSQILDDILVKLTDKSIRSIECIRIKPNSQSELSLKEALSSYTETFAKINLFIRVNVYKEQLIVDKCDKFKYASILMEEFGQTICINSEMLDFMELLITQHISVRSNRANDIVYDKNQKLFYQHCGKQTHLRIDLNATILKIFGNSHYRWIDIDTINSFFVNITELTITGVELSPFMFESILKHLKSGSTKLSKIKLHLFSYAIDHTFDYGMRFHFKFKANDLLFGFGTADWYNRASLEELYYIKNLLYEKIKDKYNDTIGSQLREMNMIIMSYAVYKYNHRFQEIKFHMYHESYCTDDRFEEDILCIQKTAVNGYIEPPHKYIGQHLLSQSNTKYNGGGEAINSGSVVT
eukprot:428421_1